MTKCAAWLGFFFLVLLTLSCSNSKNTVETNNASMLMNTTDGNRPFNTPDWAKETNIYEVNVRQYTPEGTFAAFRKHLPRLADMGVDVLWFMPIYPISKTKRKGSVGSYYASSNFNAVNDEFGTIEEFQSMVEEIHELGMKVILDWTANHTGWDHPWIEDHPEFYIKREGTDTIRHAFNPNDGGETDWYDIAQLDYSNPDLTPAMIQQMRFWRKTAKIDGFRCDVAGFVPLEFWFTARPELEKDGPLFMLAEWGDEPRHFQAAFDINYGWEFHQLLNKVAEGEAGVEDIWSYKERDKDTFAPYAYHLNFTSNHDENSWNGTEYERMGDYADALWVICATFEGAPLIYSGQEEPLRKRLKFFEKDNIGFEAFEKEDFFSTFLSLRKNNKALRNGKAGGEAQRVGLPDAGKNVLAYLREKEGDRMIAFINLSNEPVYLSPQSETVKGTYTDVSNGKSVTLGGDTDDIPVVLSPFGYMVLSND